MTPIYPLKGKRVWVAGHSGMVGSALVRRLASEDCEILTVARDRLDLRAQDTVRKWMDDVRPDAIFFAAAKVGGILANATYPAEFLYDNIVIQTNVIEAARELGTGKLLFLGSSCIYPKLAPQPIPEDALLTGPLEPTNEWYAIAKIAGLMFARACRKQYGSDFISAMPTNLYGPVDNFDLKTSHVLPALIAKAHRAKTEGRGELVIWGTGAPRREFLHVDDCADALVHLMKHYSGECHINVGCGNDISIRELAGLVAKTVGFEGHFVFDATKPDGTPQKLLDVSRLTALGWKPTIALREGIETTYRWFMEHTPEV
jgi:GDP-L-fucose synthase